MYTFAEIKEHIRTETGEFTDANLYEAFLGRKINFAQRSVANILFEAGIDCFKKTAFFTGSRFAMPSDAMPTQNAIVSLKGSSASAKASVSTSYGVSNDDLTFTAVQPGTPGNIISVKLRHDANLGTPYTPYISSVTVGDSSIQILVFISSGNTTAAQIKTLLEASVAAKTYIDTSFSSGNDGTGVITLNSLGGGDTYSLANGAGTGWAHADKVADSGEWNMLESMRSTRYPTNSFPKYHITGDTLKSRYVEIKPATINYAMMEYLFMVQNLSSETDTLGLPELFEELVILEALRKCYKFLKRKAEADEKGTEFNDEMARVKSIYGNTVAQEAAEELRHKQG